MVYDFPGRWQHTYKWALEELCLPAAYVCEIMPRAGQRSRVLAFVQCFSIVWLYMDTGEGESNFNTFCARKCGIMKIEPHYLNVFLEEET